jgi:hypothetical protein
MARSTWINHHITIWWHAQVQSLRIVSLEEKLCQAATHICKRCICSWLRGIRGIVPIFFPSSFYRPKNISPFHRSLNEAAPVYSMLISIQFIHNKQPFHDLDLLDLTDAIKAQALPAARPQKLNNEEIHLWNLFESCWRPIPRQRITAKEAVHQLQSIVQTNYD